MTKNLAIKNLPQKKFAEKRRRIGQKIEQKNWAKNSGNKNVQKKWAKNSRKICKKFIPMTGPQFSQNRGFEKCKIYEK